MLTDRRERVSEWSPRVSSHGMPTLQASTALGTWGLENQVGAQARGGGALAHFCPCPPASRSCMKPSCHVLFCRVLPCRVLCCRILLALRQPCLYFSIFLFLVLPKDSELSGLAWTQQ